MFPVRMPPSSRPATRQSCFQARAVDRAGVQCRDVPGRDSGWRSGKICLIASRRTRLPGRCWELHHRPCGGRHGAALPGNGSPRQRSAMGAFGLWVIGTVVWHALMGTVPEPITMGVIGGVALIANAACAALLYAYREGDANMQSVWICSRNDVLGNFAVLLAALGVFGTGAGWPDRCNHHGHARSA